MLQRPDTIGRRELIAGSLALAAVLAGCGGGDDGASGGGDGNGERPAGTKGGFSFTDDRGERIDSDVVPTRIVAHSVAAAALWDLGIHVVGIFGPQRRADGKPHPSVGEVDLEGIEDCGQVYDQLNVEKIASLQPDLIVSTMYDPKELWYVTEGFAPEVEAIAPTVGISLVEASASEGIERFVDLGKALGADLQAAQVRRGKARYEAARTAVEEAVAANPGVTVLVASPDVDEVYLAKPGDAADLRTFQELGVDVVEPTGPGNFWETISLEQLDKYPADLIMVDVRTLTLDAILERAEEVPTWTRLPAVEADQVVAWYAEGAYGYDSFATILEDLAAAIRGADAELV